MAFYAQKIIESGKYIEVYTYQCPIEVGRKHKHSKKRKPINSKITPVSRSDSLNRTRQSITRLVNANPDFQIFVTLTYAENIQDVGQANKDFHNFIKRLRRVYPEIKYLNVPEFQKRGAVHYHLLLDIKFIDSKQLAVLWGHGFIYISAIQEIENVGLYISCYIKKELMDSRLFGRRKIMKSNNLTRPRITKHKRRVDNFFLKNVAGCKLIKQNDYEGEYTGKTHWDLYEATDGKLVLP